MRVETTTSGPAGKRPPVRRLGWRLLSVLAVVNLAAVGLVAAPSQAQVTSCAATVADTTVEGDLVVPAGQACQLVNVTVTGNTTVEEGADLLVESGRINGGLSAGDDAFVQVIDSRVDGMTNLSQSFGMFADSTRFDRNVSATGATFVYSTDSTHWGGLFSTAGQTVLEKGFVLGSVRTDQDVLTDVFDTAVFGKLTIQAAANGTFLCHVGVALEMRVSGSGGVVQIGDPALASNCGFNVLGSLTVTDNLGADIRITGNLIAGDLDCSGNVPAPHGGTNAVGGDKTGQCASLAPAPATAPLSLLNPGSAPRTEQILELIDQRLAG